MRNIFQLLLHLLIIILDEHSKGVILSLSTFEGTFSIFLIFQTQIGAESQLTTVLRRFLTLVDDARVLILSSTDGTELLTGIACGTACIHYRPIYYIHI